MPTKSSTSTDYRISLFLSKLAPREVGGCWIWMGSKNEDGYGFFFNGVKNETAHRFAFRSYNGPIKRGQLVLHRCDNPSCVNPSHLFLGTQKDNMKDMREKGRGVNVSGSLHGRAKLSEVDVLAIREDSRTQKEIAAAYGVSCSLISQIKSRTIWAHI
jgi:hypothetical protein